MNVAEKLADYCRRSMNAEPRWHYRQYRPMRLGVSPDVEQDGDCSGHATQAYYWAGAPDPNHTGFDGSGYTGTLQHNPRVSGSYQVGDLAIYGTSTGNTTHVCTCYQAGSSSSARWTSHGSEAGPYATSLYYRSDLLFVVRPGLGNGTGGDEVNVPAWYWDWADWYLNTGRDKADRPEKAPEKIPEWGWTYLEELDLIARNHGMTSPEQDWIVWYLGGKEGERPEVPDKIPEFWWDDAEFVNAQRRVGDPGETL